MEVCTEVGIAVCELIEGREILRRAALAQDDYPHRMVDLEECTEDCGGLKVRG